MRLVGAVTSVSDEVKVKLEMALDRVDEAIDIVRGLVESNEELAESLEDVLYHLEEAGELLDSLIGRLEEE